MRNAPSFDNLGSARIIPLGQFDPFEEADPTRTNAELGYADTGFVGTSMDGADGRYDETVARAMWGEEPTAVKSYDSVAELQRSGEFSAVLNSAADIIYPMFPNNIDAGLRKRDLHPDILALADQIESIVLKALQGEQMKTLSLPAHEARGNVQDIAVRLGEYAAELIDIQTSREAVRGNIEGIRLKIKLLGHIVGRQMIDRPEVQGVIAEVAGRHESTRRHLALVLAELDAIEDETVTSDLPMPGEYKLATSAASQKPAAFVSETRAARHARRAASNTPAPQPEPQPLPSAYMVRNRTRLDMPALPRSLGGDSDLRR